MKYNRLGRAGIKVSELSFGSWLTFGAQLGEADVKALMRQAFDAGVNFFDNAEAYGAGQAEVLMGKALEDYRREDLVVSTKIFWGGEGPNDQGLSWKHLVEGTKAALARLDLDYVDLLFCHRPDPDTPMEETVRAMDFLVRTGHAFYWGTSEWSAADLESAFRVARECHCIPPVMEQPQYNLLHRHRVEREYAPIFETYGIGTTIWSPLASGLLSGKYTKGIPKGSRLDRVSWLKDRLTPEVTRQVQALERVAKDLDCTLAQLAIAWCLAQPQVSTVILGASTSAQLAENLKALEVKDRIDAEVKARIDAIVPVVES